MKYFLNNGAPGLSVEAVKIPLLKLGNYSTILKDLYRLRNDLLNNIGDSILEITSWNSLIYSTLNVIEDFEPWLKKDKKSISKAIKILYKHFEYEFILTKNRDLIDAYAEDFLNIDKLPFNEYRSLESGVRKDLNNITDLIRWYEADKSIMNFRKENRNPSRHEDSIKVDFYLRSLAEQQVILNHFLYKIKRIALVNSEKITHIGSGFEAVYKMHRNFPYSYHFRPEWFDCRIIDESAHRIDDFPIRDVYKMRELYKSDKESFYKIVLDNNKVEEILNSFDYYLHSLPFENNRKETFSYLKELFREKKWIPFFSLALPQVEGIFTEMCYVAFPEKDGKSLSDKVKKIRPIHSSSESYFDYYQYIVPRIRNSFSHTGHIPDFKLRAFDMLTDIYHLLRVFNTLHHPIVKLKKIHTKRDNLAFTSFRQYADYFTLLNSLNAKEKKKYQEDIVEFEDFLINSCDAEFICNEVIAEIKLVTDQIIKKIQLFTPEKEVLLLNLPQITKMFEDDSDFAFTLKYFFSYWDEFESILPFSVFIGGYEKHLPSLKKDVSLQLSKTKKEYGNIINIIIRLKEMCEDLDYE